MTRVEAGSTEFPFLSFFVSVKVFIMSLVLVAPHTIYKVLSYYPPCSFFSSPMSIFTRPDSPPPRQPSPEFVPAPLPSPHLQARLRKSSSKQSLSPSVPPGLHPFPAPHNFVHSTRSYDHLNERLERRRISSSPVSSTMPRSISQNTIPSTSQSVDYSRPYRRYLSHGTTYRSPPPSPTISSPPPPVPPIPAMATASKEVKPMPSQPMSVAPIRIPNFDNVSPLSESTFLPRQHPKVPLPQKQGGVGMTCLKFFSLRNAKQRVPYTTKE
jgi:hypothetical protein